MTSLVTYLKILLQYMVTTVAMYSTVLTIQPTVIQNSFSSDMPRGQKTTLHLSTLILSYQQSTRHIKKRITLPPRSWSTL
jgi:hypothetical protein